MKNVDERYRNSKLFVSVRGHGKKCEDEDLICRLMDDLTVKLMDYALSSDLSCQDYEPIQTENGEERRPLKFMTIESIDDFLQHRI